MIGDIYSLGPEKLKLQTTSHLKNRMKARNFVKLQDLESLKRISNETDIDVFNN